MKGRQGDRVSCVHLVTVSPPHLVTNRLRGAAWSARHPVTVEIRVSNPLGDADMARYAIGKAAKLKPSCFVGSTPTRPTGSHASAGHWRAQVAVTHPPSGAMQVQLLPDALTGPFVYRLEDTGPSSRKDGFDSHTGYLAKWWNRQTHDAQNVAPAKAWEFDSPLGHCGVDWSQVSSTVS